MEEEEGMASVASMDSTSLFTSSALFKIMCVVSDRQELSFVEKVQLSQDQILLLCNELVPKSAVTTGTLFTQVRIDFNALNQRCLPVVGFYGSKQMMAEAFRKQGLLGEEVVLDQLEPGLYAIVEESAIFVFYWHEGENLKEASRKDVSCNFIRYLVELSDYLHVCVQGYYPFEASASSPRTASYKGRRTKKLQISHVKNSENDVRFSDGFNVAIDGQFNKLASAPPVALGDVIFCDGYNRCAFLTAEHKPSRVSKRSELITLKDYQLRSQIESWSNNGDLNYCRMDNKHFVSLVQFGKFSRYDEYCNFMKTLNNSIAEARVGVSAESSMEAIQKSIVPSFLKILPEYFSGAQLLDEASPGTSSSQNHRKLRGSNSVDRFDQLHQELSEILVGRDCDKRLIYHGSEVKFTDPVDDGSHFIFRIEGPQKETGPVKYGQEIILKCTNPKRVLKATLQKFNEDTLQAPFLFSGERVILRMKSQAHLEGSLEVVNSSSIALQNWVKSLIPKKLQCLDRNIGFVALLVPKGRTDKQMPSVGMPLIQKILTTENLKSIERDLPDEIGKVFKQFESTGGASVDQATWAKLLSKKQVRAVISNLYKTFREEFIKNLECIPRKEFWSAFQKKLKSQGTETIYLLQQNQDLEEDKFLSAMKREMSVTTDKPLCRFIEACEVQNSWLSYNPKLILKVSIEGHEKPSIAWKISELMPRKNDLEELSRNTEHRINPTFTNQFELVTLDPEVECILKVVALKSGHLLMFIQNLADSCLCVYSCPRMGSRLDVIKRFRRGYDLLSVGEGTRFLALYNKETSKVSVFKFDESFRNLDWTGVDVDLHTFSGIGFLIWMHLIPGKRELIFIDDTHRVRVVELHEKPMMKPKALILPSPVSVALVSVDGSFLFVFRKSSDNNDEVVQASRDTMDVDGKVIDSSVTVGIYVLADVMSHLRTIRLNKSFRDLGELQLKIMNFGSQSHLVFFSGSAPRNICSDILKTISAKEVVQLQAIQNTENKVAQVSEERIISGSCPPLEYIYHIFDKFATSPALFSEDKKDVFFNVLLSTKDKKCNEHACKNVLRSLLQQLEKEKGKDFSNTEIQIDVKRFEPWISGGAVDVTGLATKAMGTWIRSLACLVPIQVAEQKTMDCLLSRMGSRYHQN